MILSLEIVLPGSAEAKAQGCICPSGPPWPEVPYFHHDGHWFRPDCPAHRNAVLAEVQRMFGRPQ